MMIKRIVALLLALAIYALSGCALIDNSEEGAAKNQRITDDFLVGVLVYVDKWDSERGEFVEYPTSNLEDENAIHFFPRINDFEGRPFIELQASKHLSNVSTNTINGGTLINEEMPYGGVEISATFMYTYELLDSIIYADSVYKRNEVAEYYSEGGGSGYMLSYFGGLSISTEQSLSATITDSSGQKNELKYHGRWTLDFAFTDYLVSAKIVEFDANHSLITTQSISLDSEEAIKYTPQEACAYVFVEEEYQVMHSDERYKYPIGTKYTQRYFVDRIQGDHYHCFNNPAKNGFVETVLLMIEFLEQQA